MHSFFKSDIVIVPVPTRMRSTWRRHPWLGQMYRSIQCHILTPLIQFSWMPEILHLLWNTSFKGAHQFIIPYRNEADRQAGGLEGVDWRVVVVHVWVFFTVIIGREGGLGSVLEFFCFDLSVSQYLHWVFSYLISWVFLLFYLTLPPFYHPHHCHQNNQPSLFLLFSHSVGFFML